MDLKRRTAMNEEQIEMDNKIWSKLPEELLMLVLSSLPTLISRNLRVVCKRWQDFLSPSPVFRQISSTLVPSSSPAFVVGGPDRSYLLHSKPLDFMGPKPLDVLTSCKSILCCLTRYRPRASTSYYICNPLTRTWIKLPPRHWHLKTLSPDHWHLKMLPSFGFYGLAFDSATKTCIFVIGINNRNDGENNMEMDIYDSHTNEWTIIKMNLSNPIFPSSQGIYSKGSFYWISQHTAMFTFHLLAFNVAERNWGIIKLPGGFYYRPHWDLTGYDGNVLVVCRNDLSLWKLNEEHNRGERYSCSEVQLFPRSLPEENARRLTKVVGNSCGWLLVYLGGDKIVVFDAQGKVVRCI